MSECNKRLQARGLASPRTCRKCGLGPCNDSAYSSSAYNSAGRRDRFTDDGSMFALGGALGSALASSYSPGYSDTSDNSRTSYSDTSDYSSGGSSGSFD